MPLYEYHCDSCGQDFDKLVSFSQADISQPCPQCGSNKTHKKISRTAVIGGSSANIQSSSTSTSSCGSGGGFT